MNRQTPKQIIARNDRWMMQNPEEWPCWPFLPVKRRPDYFTAKDGMGLMLAQEDIRWPSEKVAPVIVHAYLGDLQAPNKLENFPRTEFESLDALLAAGWVVD